MKLSERFTSLIKRRSRAGNNSRVAVVHWDRESIQFLVVSPKSRQVLAKEVGSVGRADVANPLVALADHFREHSLSVQRLVVLMSRPELDQLTLSLPPADESELPALVANAVEQQLGESEERPLVDFHVLPNSETDEPQLGSQLLAFALSAVEFHSLESQAATAGFRLAAISSRQLSPLSILRRRNVSKSSLSLAVHIYGGEAELAICRGAEPLFLRSLRITPDDASRSAEQIWLESQRCLALSSSETAALPLNWFVFTTCEAAWQVARALEDRGQMVVQPVDPLIGWEFDAGGDAETETSLVTSGANTGAAWDFLNGELLIDLLAPKKSPAPPNLLARWGVMGAAATLVAALGIYFLLSDIAKLRSEVQTLENDLAGTQKLAAKMQEKADQVLAVESWLEDQVDWLVVLDELSDRLPDGQNATVRRLTATTTSTMGVIDLSVQVAEQENISQLESRIRSAKYAATSKRINQTLDSSEYPWQFETRITFPFEVPASVQFGPRSDVAVESKPAASQTVGAADGTATQEAPQ
jgi:hypothetical protein